MDQMDLIIYALGWPFFLLYTITTIMDMIEMLIYRAKGK